MIDKLIHIAQQLAVLDQQLDQAAIQRCFNDLMAREAGFNSHQDMVNRIGPVSTMHVRSNTIAISFTAGAHAMVSIAFDRVYNEDTDVVQRITLYIDDSGVVHL